MKLKEAQLLGIVALIAVAIILLCIWGGGRESKEVVTSEEQVEQASGTAAEPGAAELAKELMQERPTSGASTDATASPQATMEIGASSEEAAIRGLIESKAPEEIGLSKEQKAAAPSVAASVSSPGAQTHVIQSGDTLEMISLKYYGTRTRWPEVLNANKGLDPKRLRVGAKLVIPALSGVTPSSVAAAAGGTPALSAPTQAAAEGRRTYTVQRGDTLFRIAQKCYNDGSRWKDIKAANPEQTRDDRALRPGSVLIIP